MEGIFKTGSPEVPLKVVLGTNSNLFLPQNVFDEAFAFDFDVSEFPAEECYRAIVTGERDLAIVHCMERDFPECSDVLIRRNQLYYLVSEQSELAKKRALRVEELEGHEICVMSSPEFIYRPFLARYRELGMDGSALRQINNIALVKNEVVGNGAVAIATSEFQQNPLPRTVAVPCAESFMEGCLYGLYRRGSENVSSALKMITRVRQLCNEAYSTRSDS